MLTGFVTAGLSAQTLEQARAMFTRGEYETAKPVFERYVKQSPNNANYNYWYGVCCLKTGETGKAIKPLELAHKRKIQNAPYYLGQAYDEMYMFDEAVEAFEDYIATMAKKKDPAEEAKAMLEKSKQSARMIKGVEEVCFIDSFVVDKENFLQAYKISEESGKLMPYNEYFNTGSNSEGTVYETEIGNKIYYGELSEQDSTLSIYTRSKLLDDWSNPTPLPESINASGSANYPFMLTDGITIYYSSNGEASSGGYDIFVTRYNTGTEGYLAPENVGMPFNSPFNDYMYVIDEYNELGWFATDRNQPDGKVCVYVFVPNTFKQTYNYEAMEPEHIRNLARLNSIEDTWKDMDIVEAAQERLRKALSSRPKEAKKADFEFVINDDATYYSLSDFKSETAKKYFLEYQYLAKEFTQQTDKLEAQRQQYAQANEAGKRNMTPAILDLEKRVQTMSEELNKMKVIVRYEENKTLNKK